MRRGEGGIWILDQLVTIGNLGGFDVIAAQTCDVEMIRGLQVNTIKVNPCLCPADNSKLFFELVICISFKLLTVFLWFCQLDFFVFSGGADQRLASEYFAG